MDINDIARLNYPDPLDVVRDALGDVPSIEVTGTVMEVTDEGTALVDFGGESTPGEDDSQWMEVPASAYLEEGDEIIVSVKGNTPIDATVPGWGNRVKGLVDVVSSVATEANQVANDASEAATEAASLASDASSAASDAQAAADAAQSTADATKDYFWADESGAHVSTSQGKSHEAGAGYNMTLGASDSAAGILLDKDDQTMASFTPTALDFYADGQLAAAYTKSGVGLYAPDDQGKAQQVAAFTRSGVSFYSGGTGAENVIAAFGADGAVIGAAGGEQVVIADGQLSLVDDGEVVAFVNSRNLGISNATITEGLYFGGYTWIPRSNGNLALKWTGV